MINTSNIFGNELDELEKLAQATLPTFGKPFQEIQKAVTARVDFPIDEYINKDGNYIAEVAVVGLSADDVKVTVKTENGRKTLTIKVNAPELTDEQKKEIDSRNWINKKIKRATKLELTRTLPDNLDVAKTTKTVDKGLLTVYIPIKEEEKPIEFEVK